MSNNLETSSADSSISGEEVDVKQPLEKPGLDYANDSTLQPQKKGGNTWSNKKKGLVIGGSIFGACALAGIIAGIVIATKPSSNDSPEIPTNTLKVSSSQVNADYCTGTTVDLPDPAWFPMKTIQKPDCSKQALIKASENGLNPSNVNNQAAFENILANCKDQVKYPGGCRVILDIPGTYRFGGNSLTYDRTIKFTNLTDFTFDGQGNRILFSRFEKFGTLTQVGNLTRALFTNIVWDWDHEKWPLATLIKVKSITPTEMTVELVDYPQAKRYRRQTLDLSKLRSWRSMHQVDPVRLSMAVRNGREWFDMDNVLGQPVSLGGNLVKFSLNKQMKPMPTVDTLYLMKHFIYDAHCIAGYMCTDCIWQDITFYGCPGKLMTVQDLSEQLLVRNVSLIRDPQRPTQRITATADGLFFNSLKDGGLRILDSEISYHGDGVTLQPDTLSITKTRNTVQDATKWVPGTPQYDFSLGDTITLKNYLMVPLHTGKIVNLVDQPSTWIMTLQPPIPQSVLSTYPTADSQGRLMVINQNRSADNVIIDGLYCHDNRARGIQIQTSNTLVINSKISHTQQPGLVVRSDGQTKEGAGVSNALITKNTFEFVDKNDWNQQGALRIYIVDVGGGNSSTYPVHNNITFLDNQIKEMPRRAFNLQNAKNVNVIGNAIVNQEANLPETSERGTIYFEDVQGFKVVGNTKNGVGYNSVVLGANASP